MTATWAGDHTDSLTLPKDELGVEIERKDPDAAMPAAQQRGSAARAASPTAIVDQRQDHLSAHNTRVTSLITGQSIDACEPTVIAIGEISQSVPRSTALAPPKSTNLSGDRYRSSATKRFTASRTVGSAMNGNSGPHPTITA